MKYNFDQIIDRRHTGALKWDAVETRWGRSDLLPMWVADMDFETPPFVIDSLLQRLNHAVLGYTVEPENWHISITRWMKSRFLWEINREQILFTPGVVTGFSLAIQCFTRPGDKVMVQPPVYYPFFMMTERNNREVVYNPLVLKEGQYRMDMEHFRKEIKGCKLFILCNPHNPGGRVWTTDELREVAAICHENGTIVVSDEIHADLTLPGYTHHPFATVSEEARMNSIVFMAPSKAFNIPGLASSYAIIENDTLRKAFEKYLEAAELGNGNIFAYIGAAAAYSHGTEWLEQVIDYIQGNIDYTEAYLKEHIPAIGMIRPQASYLIFLDCRELGLSQEELVNFFVDGARLALNDGASFGEGGERFMRLNIACPRTVLTEAMERLKSAYEALS